MLRFDRKQQNSVKQLSFNKKIINKKKLSLPHSYFHISKPDLCSGIGQSNVQIPALPLVDHVVLGKLFNLSSLTGICRKLYISLKVSGRNVNIKQLPLCFTCRRCSINDSSHGDYVFLLPSLKLSDCLNPLSLHPVSHI